MDRDDRRILLEEERRRTKVALDKEIKGLGGIPRKLCDIYLTTFNFVGSRYLILDSEEVDSDGTPTANAILITVAIMVLFFGGWFLIVNTHGYSDTAFLWVPALVIFVLLFPASILIRLVRKGLIHSAARTNSWIAIYRNRLVEIDEELRTLL